MSAETPLRLSARPRLRPTLSVTPSTIDGLRDRSARPLHHSFGIEQRIHISQQQDELVASHPGHCVALANRAEEPPGNLLEDLVARVVAMGVVDLLEVVDVAEADADMAGSTRDRQGVREAVHQQAAVGQPRQRVVQRPALQLGLGGTELGDVLDLYDEVQRYTFVVAHNAHGESTPQQGPVAPDVALLPFVAVDLAGGQLGEGRLVQIRVLAVRDLLQPRRREFIAGVPEHVAQVGVRLDEPVVEVQHGHSDGCVLDGQPESVVQTSLLGTGLPARRHRAHHDEKPHQAQHCECGQQSPLAPVVARHRSQEGILGCVQQVRPRSARDGGRSKQPAVHHRRVVQSRLDPVLPRGTRCAISGRDDRRPRRIYDVATSAGDRLAFQELLQRTLSQAETHRQHAVAPCRKREGECHDRLALHG